MDDKPVCEVPEGKTNPLGPSNEFIKEWAEKVALAMQAFTLLMEDRIATPINEVEPFSDLTMEEVLGKIRKHVRKLVTALSPQAMLPIVLLEQAADLANFAFIAAFKLTKGMTALGPLRERALKQAKAFVARPSATP